MMHFVQNVHLSQNASSRWGRPPPELPLYTDDHNHYFEIIVCNRWLKYSINSSEKESRPFREEAETHLYFNQHFSSAPVYFCFTHLALPACPQPQWPGVFTLLTFDHAQKKEVKL